ncbi:MAG: 5-formyltetrahydrofolate cyclo-ligase [Gemmatimonadota bacterium]|jgi:5-formyltetrahydrofolate cyclo-ligase|nr:5-formyltetrahydrofolate cyclo-ligase [Gemmatimonadota bacterium]
MLTDPTMADATTGNGSGLTKEKAEIRAEVRARLQLLTDKLREVASTRIAEQIWTIPAVATARSILLFASLPAEVPTDTIADEARRRGIQVVYPRCLPETRAMSLHSVETPELLLPGFGGIREPSEECPLTPLAAIDVIFVPGLAWDDTGHRLGRGAGYYDRLFALPGKQPFRVGLFFGIQQMPVIPVDSWDVSLDAVVTENGVRMFS